MTTIIDISPATLPKALTETTPTSAAMPSARQINHFEQLMNAARAQQHTSEALQKMPVPSIQPSAIAPLSERAALLSALQSQEQEIKKRFRPDWVTGAQDTAAALQMQGEVAMAVLKLELLTKVTNGVVQGINKLTSMA